MSAISRTSVRIVLAALAMCALIPASSQAGLESDFDQYLRAASDVWKFQGAVLVAKDGQIVYRKPFGYADHELDVKNRTRMKFQIGSITKQFTAACIMLLVEEGKIKLDDPITRHLPDYPSNPGDRITIHHLLSHTSGIPNYTAMLDVWNRRALETSVADLMATFKDKPLEFEPGQEWSYSNSGYIVLGAIVEAASGMSYEEFVESRIFDALGMENSGYDHREEIIEDRAKGYYLGDDGELKNASFVHMSVPYAAGALYSTVNDLLTWDQALYGEQLLSSTSLEKMFTPVKNNYGYGFMIQDVFDRKLIWHNGGIDGFLTTLNRWVDEKVTIIVLSNNISAPVEDIANSLAAIMFGRPYDIPVKKEPIAVNPASYSDYVGVYKIEEDEYRIITVEDGSLFSQRTGGARLEIFPEAKDKFFFEHDNTVTITFVRNDAGEVISHVVHQQGEDGSALKLEGPEAEEILARVTRADVDPSIYKRYSGEYQLAPEFMLKVWTEGDKIMTQATGQAPIEIFPSSETEFYLTAVDAQITFIVDETDGTVTGLILHQGGRDIPADKIK